MISCTLDMQQAVTYSYSVYQSAELVFCHGAAFKVTRISCRVLYIAYFMTYLLVGQGEVPDEVVIPCAVDGMFFVYSESVRSETTHVFPHTACSGEVAVSKGSDSAYMHTQLIKNVQVVPPHSTSGNISRCPVI